jgi:predicted DNA-binding transcriptional regulator AlpA
MPDQVNDGAVLSPKEASVYMGRRLSVQTLAKMRLDGRGPRFVKLGSKVGYRRSSIDEWLASRERTSTSSSEPTRAIS